MRKVIILVFALLLVTVALPAAAQSEADVEAVIMEYLRTDDSGDLDAQARLMTSDRSWMVTGAGRRLDQAKNMEIQKKGRDMAQRMGDSSTTISEARDLVVRFVADDVAVATFYWYSTTMPPPEGGQIPPRLTTHVLVQDGGSWKIAHTHISPMSAN